MEILNDRKLEEQIDFLDYHTIISQQIKKKKYIIH